MFATFTIHIVPKISFTEKLKNVIYENHVYSALGGGVKY